MKRIERGTVIRRVIKHPITILIAILVVAVALTWGSYEVLNHYIKSNMNQQTKQIAHGLDKDINKIFEILDAVAITSADYNIEDDLIAHSKILSEYLVTNQLQNIGLVNLNGNTYVDETMLNIADRYYFQEAIKGRKVIETNVINRNDGILCTVFAQPLIVENKIQGAVYGVLSNNAIEYLLNESIPDHNGNIFIIDQNKIIGSIVTDLNKEETSKLIEHYRLAIYEKGSGEEYIKFKGKQYLLSYETLDEVEWTIIELLPQYIFNEINIVIGIIILGVASSYIMLCYKFLLDYRKCKNERSQMEKSKTLMVIKVNNDGEIIYCNQYAKERLGYAAKEINRKEIFDILFKSEYSKIEKILKAEKLGVSTIDLNFLSKNYKKVYTICTVKQVMNTERESTDLHIEISAVDISLFDLTEKDKGQINALYEEIARSEEELQKKYEELCEKKEALQISEERYSMIIDTASIGIWDWDLKNHRIYCSPKIQEIFDCKMINEEEDINMDWIHPDNVELAQNIVERCTLKQEDQYEFECRVLNKHHQYMWVYVVGKILRNQDYIPIRMAGSMADINEKKINEERIKYMAYYDELTGLANKNYMKEVFEKHKSEGNTCFYLDVDNFKFINDSFGYRGGDKVLAETGKRLERLQSNQVTIARIAADEFAILLEQVTDEEEIRAFVEHFNQYFEETFVVDEIDFGISFSMGVAIYTPNSDDTFEDVLNKACTAMHKAKDKGKRNYIFFEDEFKQRTLEKIQIESELRQAIQKQEFTLYYQPQMEITTGKVRGFEALIRWIKEDGTMVPPDKFISVAEETGLMVPIGVWVVEEACRFINQLKTSGFNDIYVAVNISVVQLMQDNFAEKIEEIIGQAHIDATKLHLEITETIFMESMDVNIEKVEKIKQKGVKISLDDFGKGYSSLTYLKQLPINILKIEKAFVDDILENQSKNIIGAIINLGHELSLEVVAEGVEEESQLEYLKQYNCDMIQGYLCSKPIPKDKAIYFIQQNLKQ